MAIYMQVLFYYSVVGENTQLKRSVRGYCTRKKIIYDIYYGYNDSGVVANE